MYANKRAFSIAEAMMTLLIFSIALAAAAPLISGQMKRSMIQNIHAEQDAVPKGAIMFFDDRKTCPDGWKAVVTSSSGLSGYYPRLAQEGDSEIGQKKEQMVHKHKHVVLELQAINALATVNYFRYGPFRNKNSYANSVLGDRNYPVISTDYNGKLNYSLSADTSQLLRGGSYVDDGNNWYAYTSDGLNRWESLSVLGGDTVRALTCPNRDEAGTCKENNTAFSFVNGYGNTVKINNLPFLSDMPLVGDENRPNSVVWLACRKE